MNAFRARRGGAWHRPTVALIDLDAFEHNLRVIRASLPSRVGIMAVVKADAYGHGAAHCCRVLARNGVLAFGVAIAEEGIALRRAGVREPVVVLGGMIGSDDSVYRHYRLTPVVYRADQVAALAWGGPIDVHVKLDTGMSRIGAREDELPELLGALDQHRAVRVVGLMSHFANADLGASDPANEQQKRLFARMSEAVLARGHKPRLIHFSNSAGALTQPDAAYTMVRVGIAAYGVAPSRDAGPSQPLMPVLSLRTEAVHVKTVPEGSGISYGHVFRTTRASRIATLPIGYADGWPRPLTGQAFALVRGQRVPFVGTICMDSCMIDVTDAEQVSGRAIEIGEEVVLIGEQAGATISCEEVATWAGTVHYEILTGLSPRIPRLYSDDTAARGEMMMALDDALFEPGC